MNTSRRGFLGAMLAAAVAPAIVRAESLMKIVVPKHVAEGHFITIYGYKIGNGEQLFTEHIPEDPWIVEMEVKPVNQFTIDKWYTPPERVINARPYIHASEIDMFDPVVDRAVAQLRELEIKRRRVPHRPKSKSLLDLARDALDMKIRT